MPPRQSAPGPAPQPGAPALQQVSPSMQPGFYRVPGSVPPPNAPTQAIPVVSEYQRPAWGDTWQQPPRAGRSGLLAGGLALLVAALITGVVIFTQGGDPQQTAQPGSGGQTQLPPVPPPTTDPHSIDPIKTAPDTTAPDTADPVTTAPDTTAPDTTDPVTTSKTSTSKPHAGKPTASRTEDKQAAEQAATAWADAVTAGDFDGVRAVSCDQDLQAYDSGDLQNPATLAGRYALTFDRIIVSPPYGVAYFTIDPAIDGESSLTSFVTSTSGQWKVCMTVSDPEDL